MRRPKIYIMYNSDSSPSCDDSHAAIHVMPKNKNSGFLPFRHLSLSFLFLCTCCIPGSTVEKCDLYLILYFDM